MLVCINNNNTNTQGSNRMRRFTDFRKPISVFTAEYFFSFFFSSPTIFSSFIFRLLFSLGPPFCMFSFAVHIFFRSSFCSLFFFLERFGCFSIVYLRIQSCARTHDTMFLSRTSSNFSHFQYARSKAICAPYFTIPTPALLLWFRLFGSSASPASHNNKNEPNKFRARKHFILSRNEEN